MKITLNGVLIDTSEYTGNQKAILEITVIDANGNRERVVSQEFVFTGAAYAIIAAEFMDNPLGKVGSLDVKIFDDTCENCPDVLIFEGLLIAGGINKWCIGECSVAVVFSEYTDETKKRDCINSTLVYDNAIGFQTNPHPKVPYCISLRPDWLFYIGITHGILTNILFEVLSTAVFIIQGLINSINLVINALNLLIPGTGNDIGLIGGDQATNPFFLMQNFQQVKDELNAQAMGCNRLHPSPFVRKYIQNVCAICGLNFSSSIYNSANSDYYNAMYLSAPVEKGVKQQFAHLSPYIVKNAPNLTLDLFLDQLKPVHNAKWAMIGTTIHFERKDHPIFTAGAPWVSYDTLDDQGFIVEKLCYEFRADPVPAYGTFKYTLDPVDVAGNEAADRFNDLVEWNQPYSKLQTGHQDVVLPFSTPRFRDDGIEPDLLNTFAGIPGSLGNAISNFDKVLILEKHLCFNPKLLIWDGVSMSFARTKKFEAINAVPWNTTENYNYPYMFNEFGILPNTAYPTNYYLLNNSQLFPASLYVRFYSIDNPKLIIDKHWSWTFTFRYNCTMIQTAFTARFIQLPDGIGRINRISVDLESKTITVQGDV